MRNLKNLPLQLPKILNENYSSFHLYIVRIKSNGNQSYSDLYKNFHKNGILINLHYLPIHLHPYYKKLGFRENSFVEAEQYAKEAITLPLYPSLTDKEHAFIISKAREILLDA